MRRSLQTGGIFLMLVIVTISMLQCRGENATPIVTVQGFPDNDHRSVPVICYPGEWPCVGDCIWEGSITATVESPDGIKKITAKVGKVGEVLTNKPALPKRPCGDDQINLTKSTFTHEFFVPCPLAHNGETPQLFDIKFSATDCDGETGVGTAALNVICYYCTNDARAAVDGNGHTAVSAVPRDTNIVVQFVVTNVYDSSSTIGLEMTSTQSWSVAPPIPESISLGAQESMEFMLTVTVPGGLPDGTTDEITLTANANGTPVSATVTIGLSGDESTL